MSNEKPSIGSRWQHKNTKKIYRVFSALDADKSSHGADAIEYQDVESSEIRVMFCSLARDWHDDFAPIDLPLIGSHWRHNDTGTEYVVAAIPRGAKSLHGDVLIEYHAAKSSAGECYVRFAGEWHEDFTRLLFF